MSETIYVAESEAHEIDVLAQAIIHIATTMPLSEPVREQFEVLAGIIVEKARGLDEYLTQQKAGP